jgi:hypothetical protein
LPENIKLVAEQAAVLFILMAVGGIAAKAGWLKTRGCKQMTNIVLYFATPSIIIRSFLEVEFTAELINGMLLTAAFAAAVHIAGVLTAEVMFRKSPQGRGSVFRMAVTFSNCGFMGIPLATGILGMDCVVYIAVYIAVFQLFAWTYGVSLFYPGQKPSLKAVIVNPGVLSLAAGLLIAAFGWNPPRLVSEPIGLIAAVNSPVAMMVLGYYLFTTSLRPQKGEGGMWAAMAVKLIALPAAALGISMALGLSGLWLAAALILAAAPTATNAVLFAARYDGDTALAARVVSTCTLLSMVTMPVLIGAALAFNSI